MLHKSEVIDIMLRPQPVPPEFMDQMILYFMRKSSDELMIEFTRATHLTLLPAGADLFQIKY